MEPMSRPVRILVSGTDPVTFMGPQAGTRRTDLALASPAEVDMLEAEESGAPSKAACRQALRNAEKYERLLHPLLTAKGVHIRTVVRTSDVRGHLVHSVEPVEVHIPELEQLHRTLAVLKREHKQDMASMEALEETLEKVDRVSKARAVEIASLEKQLSTRNEDREALLNMIRQEREEVVAQAAEVGKWRIMYEEAEEARQHEEDEVTRTNLVVHAQNEWYTRLSGENERLGHLLSLKQTEHLALWHEYHDYFAKAQEALGAAEKELAEHRRDLGRLASKAAGARAQARRRNNLTRRTLPALLAAQGQVQHLLADVQRLSADRLAVCHEGLRLRGLVAAAEGEKKRLREELDATRQARAAAQTRERAAIAALGREEAQRRELADCAAKQTLDLSHAHQELKEVQGLLTEAHRQNLDNQAAFVDQLDKSERQLIFREHQLRESNASRDEAQRQQDEAQCQHNEARLELQEYRARLEQTRSLLDGALAAQRAQPQANDSGPVQIPAEAPSASPSPPEAPAGGAPGRKAPASLFETYTTYQELLRQHEQGDAHQESLAKQKYREWLKGFGPANWSGLMTEYADWYHRERTAERNRRIESENMVHGPSEYFTIPQKKEGSNGAVVEPTYVPVGEGRWRDLALEADQTGGWHKEACNMDMLLPSMDWNGEADYPADRGAANEEEATSSSANTEEAVPPSANTEGDRALFFFDPVPPSDNSSDEYELIHCESASSSGWSTATLSEGDGNESEGALL